MWICDYDLIICRVYGRFLRSFPYCTIPYVSHPAICSVVMYLEYGIVNRISNAVRMSYNVLLPVANTGPVPVHHDPIFLDLFKTPHTSIPEESAPKPPTYLTIHVPPTYPGHMPTLFPKHPVIPGLPLTKKARPCRLRRIQPQARHRPK